VEELAERALHPLEGTYFNPRDTVKPPAMLRKVFPKVEEGLTSIRKDPSTLDKRLCEVGFLRLMDFLRTLRPDTTFFFFLGLHATTKLNIAISDHDTQAKQLQVNP
jgi:hypothetical protein